MNFAFGNWSHLFGIDCQETLCRILIDLKEEKVIAAQEWTGLKFEKISGARLIDLSESVIGANEAHLLPEEFNLEVSDQPPSWLDEEELMPTHATQDQISKIEAAFDRVNTLLDAAGALENEAVLKAMYQLRLEIVRAACNPERLAAAEETLQELAPTDDPKPQVSVSTIQVGTGRFARITSTKRDLSVLLDNSLGTEQSLLVTAKEWHDKGIRLLAMSADCVEAAKVIQP